MKKIRSDYITKGIVLTISGALIGFFPGVISLLFYIIGGIIIVGSVFMLLGGLGEGMDGSLFGSGIAGIIIGAIVCLLPRLISVGIPIIAGIIFLYSGISRLISALKGGKSPTAKKAGIIFGAVLSVFGAFLLFSPFKAGVLVRIIIGVLMIALGVFNFYVAHVAKQRIDNNVPNIIDV